jgi:hypothetical protein
VFRRQARYWYVVSLRPPFTRVCFALISASIKPTILSLSPTLCIHPRYYLPRAA